jgi:hypothetical protein
MLNKKQKFVIIIVISCVLASFIMFTIIGCVPFLPWVMANGGHGWMPWCQY